MCQGTVNDGCSSTGMVSMTRVTPKMVVYTETAGISLGNIARTVQLRDTTGTHVCDSSVSRLVAGRVHNSPSVVPSISIYFTLACFLFLPKTNRADPPAVVVIVVVVRKLFSYTSYLTKTLVFFFQPRRPSCGRSFHKSSLDPHKQTKLIRVTAATNVEGITRVRPENMKREKKNELHLAVLR